MCSIPTTLLTSSAVAGSTEQADGCELDGFQCAMSTSYCEEPAHPVASVSAGRPGTHPTKARTGIEHFSVVADLACNLGADGAVVDALMQVDARGEGDGTACGECREEGSKAGKHGMTGLQSSLLSIPQAPIL